MLRFLLMIAFLGLPFSANAELRLLMFEQDGCFWCAQWGHRSFPYLPPKPRKGARAPLQRIDIFDPLPEAYTIKIPPAFTPTFVLLRDGTEIGRIEGYPGADFFWSLMEQMMTPLPEYVAAKLDS